MSRASAPAAAPRVFLLGVGAQKAGTSWLQDHLARHPAVDFGPLKEYHVFDVRHLPHYAHVAARRDPSPVHRPRLFLHYLLRGRRWPGAERVRRRLRRGEAYADHFAGLLARPGITLTGDVTPDYSGLPAAVFASIRDTFAARGIETRALFVMRDPVERCISAVRMYRGRRPDSHGLPIAPGDSTAAVLDRLHAGAHFEHLTRYDRTLANLWAALPEAAVCTLFYEELFTAATVRRVEAFCGLSARAPAFGREVNASAFKDEPVDDDVRARVARHYRAVYAFAAARWGAAAMARRWPGYRYL